MHFRHVAVFLSLLVATYVRSVYALTNIDLLNSTTHSDQSKKSKFNLIDDSTQQDEQANRKTIQNNSETYNKSSRFFDSESSSKSEQENPDIVGTWEGKCNLAGINYYIRLSCLEGGICCGLISILEGSDMFGYQGCDRYFTTSWMSHGTEITIPLPAAEGSNTTNYDARGIAHISSENIGASSGILKLELKSPACLVLKSGSGDCTAPLPIGLTPDYPDRLVLNKISKDQKKFDLHTCYRNAAQFSKQAYDEANGATIRTPIGPLGVCKPDFNPIGNLGATIHEGDDGRYYLAFKGTAPNLHLKYIYTDYLYSLKGDASKIKNDIRDILADARQASGCDQIQYDQAIELATFYQNQLDPKREGKLIITGHSLGGGLAMAAALKTYGYAITFNTASINTLYSIGTIPKKILNYRIKQDVVISSAEFISKISQISYNILFSKTKLSTYGTAIELKLCSVPEWIDYLPIFNYIFFHSIDRFTDEPCNPDGSVQESQIISERKDELTPVF